MTKTSPKADVSTYKGAIPITEDELLENLEQTIDRCEAGEIFVLIRNGEPIIYGSWAKIGKIAY